MNIAILIVGVMTRHFDAFGVIFAFPPQAHWIRHTSKPPYTKFHALYIKTTCPSSVFNLLEIFYCLSLSAGDFRGMVFNWCDMVGLCCQYPSRFPSHLIHRFWVQTLQWAKSCTYCDMFIMIFYSVKLSWCLCKLLPGGYRLNEVHVLPQTTVLFISVEFWAVDLHTNQVWRVYTVTGDNNLVERYCTVKLN